MGEGGVGVNGNHEHSCLNLKPLGICGNKFHSSLWLCLSGCRLGELYNHVLGM